MANIEIWKPLSNPFRELTKMETALERMFENFSKVTKRVGGNGFIFAPSCEVNEDNNQYVLKFDMPGVPKDQVKIELSENHLTISAERKEEKKSETNKTHIEELSYGSYMRTFALPSTIDEKKVEAKFDNGVLTVTIPKVESTKAKQIAVH